MSQLVLTKRQHRLLSRIVSGDCPRASHSEYNDLCDLPGLRGCLQMESALAADTRAGYIITALHSQKDTGSKITQFYKDNRCVDEFGDQLRLPSERNR